jgi:hypothetical protein
MKLPIIDAQSVRGKIGIETSPGGFDIRQHRAVLDIHSTPAKIDISSKAPELYIDSTRFWEAMNGGNVLALTQRMASQIPGIVMQNMERIVEKGNRMAALNKGGPNPIPDMALQDFLAKGTGIEYMGSPSYKSVDIQFSVQKPDIHVALGGAEIRVSVQKPDIEYHRGSVRTFMEQYPKVTIIPPIIDMSV